MLKISENLTLKACRIIARVPAEELAKFVGVAVDTVYKWEKGRSYPNAPQMMKIIQCFENNGYEVTIGEINFSA